MVGRLFVLAEIVERLNEVTDGLTGTFYISSFSSVDFLCTSSISFVVLDLNSLFESHVFFKLL